MTRDPICGMAVDEASALRVERDGQTFPAWPRRAGALHRRIPAGLVPILAGLLAWGAVAVAEPAPAASNLTLAAAVELAVRDNAGLRSLRARQAAMQARPAQAGAWPNPMLTYGGMDLADGGTWPDTDEKRLMLQQAFPWFGKRGLRAELATQEAEAIRHAADGATRDAVMQVTERYFELAAVQRFLAIAGEDEVVLRRLEKMAETLYATGERAQVDVLQARAELTMLKQKQLAWQARAYTLSAGLNTLLGRPADAPLHAAAPPLQAGPDGLATALAAAAAARSPEVLAAETELARASLERRLMAKESWPDYTLGLEYRDLGDSDDLLMFTVSVELPVWRSKIRSGVHEAERMQAAGEAAHEEALRQSAREVQDAAFAFQAARRTLDLDRTELIPQAEARFTASEAGYRAGKVDFADLLESERFLLEVRTMTAMAEAAVGLQAARLARATGAEDGAGPVGAARK